MRTKRSPDSARSRARYLSCGSGRERLAAVRIFTQNWLALHTAQQSLYRRRRCYSQLHCGNALCGSKCQDACRARRPWRRVYGLGPSQWQKPCGSIKDRFPVWSGALATAGDVVFFGTLEGYFKAINAKTGEELWSFKTGSGIIGQPVTYRGPDGKQYVADPLRRWWMGRSRSFPADLMCAILHGALGFTGAMNRTSQIHQQRRPVVCFRASLDCDCTHRCGSRSRMAATPLKVCADPDNLPFSNRQAQGFDNKDRRSARAGAWPKSRVRVAARGAGLCARESQQKRLRRAGRSSSTVPSGAHNQHLITAPATFSSRARDRRLKLNSFDDPRLREMKIGVQVLDDDYAPPARALSRRQLAANIVGFDIYR